MVDRIHAILDVYSHLRVEVALPDRERGPRPRTERNVSPGVAGKDPSAERRQRPRPAEEETGLVRFEQSSIGGDEGEAADAVEVLPELEASVLPSDPRMAAVARLYRRNGRMAASRSSGLGTRLNAVA